MIAAASEDASGSAGRTESTSTKNANAMRELPQRPDLDQLRRQARELYRGATRGDAGAIRRIRALSKPLTITSAQLALAASTVFRAGPASRPRSTAGAGPTLPSPMV
jgi:hypothetical protein